MLPVSVYKHQAKIRAYVTPIPLHFMSLIFLPLKNHYFGCSCKSDLPLRDIVYIRIAILSGKHRTAIWELNSHACRNAEPNTFLRIVTFVGRGISREHYMILIDHNLINVHCSKIILMYWFLHYCVQYCRKIEFEQKIPFPVFKLGTLSVTTVMSIAFALFTSLY